MWTRGRHGKGMRTHSWQSAGIKVLRASELSSQQGSKSTTEIGVRNGELGAQLNSETRIEILDPPSFDPRDRTFEFVQVQRDNPPKSPLDRLKARETRDRQKFIPALPDAPHTS